MRSEAEQIRARREALLAWLRERRSREALTEREIAALSRLYRGYGSVSLCVGDLRALRDEGVVEHPPGRPARWQAR